MVLGPDKLDHFWLETASEKIRQGHFPSKPCSKRGKTFRLPKVKQHQSWLETASEKNRKCHLPYEPCSMCGKTLRPPEVKQQQEECLGPTPASNC